MPPIRNEPPSSPDSRYPHQQYHPGPAAPPGIASGAPVPPTSEAAAQAAVHPGREVREVRDERGEKRPGDWGDDIGSIKKRDRRDSPSATRSPVGKRSSSEDRPGEDRVPKGPYLPSGAAHGLSNPAPHSTTLPAINAPPQATGGQTLPPIDSAAPSNGPPSAPPSANPPVENESKETIDQGSAKRQFDNIDEDYNDDGEDQGVDSPAKRSPNGSATGAAKVNEVAGNGRPDTPTKVESS
ncbi:hypothetical protein N7488_010495 [Penicillium malachiteum]|nr:hypothetical protein N7488_010495 [Penicillium malachiteum]